MVVLFMLRLKCGSVLQFSYRGNKAQLSSVSEKLEIQNVYGCLFQFSTENWFDILLFLFTCWTVTLATPSLNLRLLAETKRLSGYCLLQYKLVLRDRKCQAVAG